MKAAFPTPYIPGRDVCDDQPAKEGMSLREWYAGLAMQAFISNEGRVKAMVNVMKKAGLKDEEYAEVFDTAIAESAFATADAMILESIKKKQ